MLPTHARVLHVTFNEKLLTNKRKFERVTTSQVIPDTIYIVGRMKNKKNIHEVLQISWVRKHCHYSTQTRVYIRPRYESQMNLVPTERLGRHYYSLCPTEKCIFPARLVNPPPPKKKKKVSKTLFTTNIYVGRLANCKFTRDVMLYKTVLTNQTFDELFLHWPHHHP